MGRNPDAILLFFDEGRFGFKPEVGRRWGRKGGSKRVVVRPGYRNFYVFSAVSPTSGQHFSLLLPWVSTDMMSLYLRELKSYFGTRDLIVVLDQAGWHVSTSLEVPPNIKLIFLPPYSPELNPVERLWQWLKRHYVRNRWFESLEQMMDHVAEALQSPSPDFLTSLCRCSYILH